MNRNNILLYLYGISAILLAGIVAREAIDGGIAVTTDYDFTYQVSLRVRGANHSCGGAIINKKSILTAAHCVVNDGQFIDSHMSILAGTHDLNRNNQPAVTIQVRKIYVPEEYFHSTPDNPVADIAVLGLLNRIELLYFDDELRMELPPAGRNDTDKIAVIAGYGRDHQLRYAEARVLSHQQCQRMHHSHQLNENAIFCAKVKHEIGSGLRGVCNGDEGGPLVLGQFIIGILSKVAPHCDEMPSSAIYTRVSNYVAFILRAEADQHYHEIRTHVLPIHRLS